MNYKLIAEKQKELISHLMHGSEPAMRDADVKIWHDEYEMITKEIKQLESEPDIDTAEMSFNEHFKKDDKSCSNCKHHYQNGKRCDARPCRQGSNWEKQSEPTEIKRETAGVILFKHRLQSSPFTEEKMIQCMIEFASQSLPEISDEEIYKMAKDAIETSRGALSPLVEVGIAIGAKLYRNEIKSRQ